MGSIKTKKDSRNESKDKDEMIRKYKIPFPLIQGPTRAFIADSPILRARIDRDGWMDPLYAIRVV